MSKWLALVSAFAPTILALFGVNPVVGQLVVSGIMTEETVRGAGTGAEKKAAVLAGVASGIHAINTARLTDGKPTIGDPGQVSAQVGGAIDLVVGIVNSVHDQTPAAIVTP